MINLHHYLVASAALFVIGFVGMVTRRNAILLLLSIEILFNAANLALVAASRYLGNLNGQILVFFSMTVAAAEVSVGLAIAILLVRHLKTLNADEVRLLKW
ncbi:MAG: NADH-quinone oxidoreductase subunit NuoK [Candidatus Omnitrophica bacterium]|nr:NADH-quinone oxidoreductase subunit NuoK [Candidatus Omnitrophota bacterium]